MNYMYAFWFLYESFKHFTLFDFRLNFKLVLAEPLDDDKNSHVQNFLNHHGGPGLQHIGLSTSNVAETVQIMTDLGVQFRNPPPTYYKLVRISNRTTTYRRSSKAHKSVTSSGNHTFTKFYWHYAGMYLQGRPVRPRSHLNFQIP